MFKDLSEAAKRDYSKSCTDKIELDSNRPSTSLAILPDGRLASPDSNGIRLWDIANKAYTLLPNTSQDSFTGIRDATCDQAYVVLPDNRLAAASIGGQINVFDTLTLSCLLRLKSYDHTCSLLSLPNNRLVSGSYNGRIIFWDLTKGEEEIDYFRILDSKVPGLILLSQGSQLAACCLDFITIWDLATGKKLQTLEGCYGDINAILALPDSAIVSASSKNVMKIWDSRSGKCTQTIKSVFSGHSHGISYLAYLPDKHIASASNSEKVVKIWDLKNGKCLQTLQTNDKNISSLLSLPDNRLACGTSEKIVIWNFSPLQSKPKSKLSEKSNDSSLIHQNTKVAPILSYNAGLAPVETNLSAAEFDVKSYMIKADNYYDKKKYKQAMKWYIKAAAKGNVEAEKRVFTLEKLIIKLKLQSAPNQEIDQSAEKYYKKGEYYYAKRKYQTALIYYKLARMKNFPQAIEKIIDCEKLINTDKNKLVAANNKIDFDLTFSDIKITDRLGEGNFGIVYKGIWQNTVVAIKRLKVNQLSDDALKEFDRESKVMSQLRHPQVINFYKIYTEANQYAIVMEYCDKGSLYQWLRTPEAENWTTRIQISIDIGKGLSYLHQHQLLHRDLKSLNVLLDKQLNAKITDFGLSKVKTETSTTSSNTQGIKGTLRWLAPELVSGKEKQHSEKTDMYSYGMVLWEIASRKDPYQDEANEMMVANWISKGKKEDIPAQTPYSFALLIGKCWEKRAEKRPTAKMAYEELEIAQKASTQTPAEIQTYSSDYKGNLASEPIEKNMDSNYRHNLMS